jgi:competence protein ComEA
VVLLNLIAFVGLAFALRRPTQGLLVEILPPPTITPAPTPTPQVLTVYVSGAVARPGVYTLPDHGRVRRAINAAGGFAEGAIGAAVNLAELLMDGQQIHVPREGEAPRPVAPAGSPFSGDQAGPIDINTATAEQLTALPRIGPVMAGRIVEYRKAHGPFRRMEDIKKVRGIGDATFEGLKDLITVH